MTNAPKKIICRNPVKFLSLVKNSLRKSSNHQHKTRMRTTQTHTRLAQHPPATPPPPPPSPHDAKEKQVNKSQAPKVNDRRVAEISVSVVLLVRRRDQTRSLILADDDDRTKLSERAFSCLIEGGDAEKGFLSLSLRWVALLRWSSS